ncbi:hypothetical protein PybrP1_002755 [[Pythium] brassicae (nom. inval.)]|nr:hypothetical protein PybrP1_002755 [[Pythium] brassicae (nom. inval.)]
MLRRVVQRASVTACRRACAQPLATRRFASAVASVLAPPARSGGRAAAAAAAASPARAFSAAPGGGTAPPVDAEDENRFLELADTMLHDILSWIDGVEEMLEESDISLSQGVLKIDLGEGGTWVLNRQIPNRQIWWSSPISGPRRYEYDAASGTWRNTRDGSELMELLRNEIFEATGVEIYE